MRRRAANQDGLARDLESLGDLDTEALVLRWCETFGRPPPRRLSRRLLLLGIGYRMQEEALGGLSGATAQRLDRVARDLAVGRPIAVRAPAFKPGTKLLREWHGETHEVILLEEGVLYRGERLRSLSEAARRITGARWSGPRFFGLNAAEADHGA